MSGEWEDVGAPCQDATADGAEASAASFLESVGLGKYAQRIVEETDAESVEDLKLLDMAMVEEVIKAVDLKLVSAKKLRTAIAELRGEAVPPLTAPSTPPTSGAFPDGSASPHAPGDRDARDAVEPAPAEAVQAPPPVQECVAICIDRSGSMGMPFNEVTLNVVKNAVAERTRMEAVKAMFYAYRDRAGSVGSGSLEIGLIQFDNFVERLLDLTPELDRFEAIVDDMEKRGQTAIYSAIVEAAGMLEKRFDEASQTDLRILALTDGQNNIGVPPEEALRAANRIGAVVDAIIVGDRPDANLRKIVSATGGECYQINDLGEGFELLEAEGVVSLRARRGGVDKPPFKLREMVDFGSISEKSMTSGAAVKRAPALAPSLASKSVVDVASLKDGAAASASRGGASVKRVLMELKQVASGADGVWMHSGEGVHIFPAPEDINFWRVLVEGPAASPFEGGVFALAVVIPDGYPMRAPSITFETPVYHCNVSDSGKVCLGILHDKWSPALSVPKCLETIRTLLKSPDTDDSLRQWIAELTIAHQKSGGADTRYYDKARECTRQEASMTVADWKQKWGC